MRCNTLAFSPPPSSSHALHPKSLTSPSPQAPANLSPKPPPHPTPLPRPPGDLRRHHRAHLPYISPIPPYISPTSAGDLRRHPRAHRQPGLSLGQVAAAPAADVRISPLHSPGISPVSPSGKWQQLQQQMCAPPTPRPTASTTAHGCNMVVARITSSRAVAGATRSTARRTRTPSKSSSARTATSMYSSCRHCVHATIACACTLRTLCTHAACTLEATHMHMHVLARARARNTQPRRA